MPENDLSRKARANTDALDAEEYESLVLYSLCLFYSHQLEEAISGAIVRPTLAGCSLRRCGYW